MKLTQKRVRMKMIEGRRLRRNAFVQEEIGALQLHSSGNSPLLPILDALSTPTGVPENPSELRGTTELVDQLPVSDSGESFFVHASLNTTFKQKSNGLLNNEMFNSAKITGMHPTMTRLYEAAEKIHGITGQTPLAKFLNESPQVLNNWERRGMSKTGMFKAAEQIGISAIWLLNGEGPMRPGKLGNTDENRPFFDDLSNVQQKENSASALDPIRYSLDVTKFRRVYVVSMPSAGLPERIWKGEEYPVGATKQYAELATSDPQSFLVPVIDDTMIPRYNPGEFALVEPATEPELEDDVLVRLTTGETMLKRLLARRGGIRLGSYHAQDVQTFRPEEISWMYYVAHPVPARKIKNRM